MPASGAVDGGLCAVGAGGEVERGVGRYSSAIYRKEKDVDKDVQQFLEFRKKFTKREWHELNRAVEVRLNEKADQLELDDFDLKVITERLERYL
ncbi:hypothetical protein [Streptococcus suis]|uniref:hypothetical protein n=2 Tax=Streptococcus suis TaxID=1307 RepID=UPI0007698685|nr:hypothetical protein [Streptococcus suis]NQH66417.1 hypothetical protein [Streptococcus suis]CYU81458.1 Uncharacterised protein [Streptococcus suis]